MAFIKYQHLERLGTQETEGILDGIAYVFYKIDGTNASVWWDEENKEICAGSRNRELSLGNDNAGFLAWTRDQVRLASFFHYYPHLRLYGEWLVPHSLKTYREDAWRNFYIFDVMDEDGNYLHYDQYKNLLDQEGLDYIPPIGMIINGNTDQIYQFLDKTGQFLIKDGEGRGEGLVIKNYDYSNKYGRQTWAKVVTNEFKILNHKEMGAPLIHGAEFIEQNIINRYCTDAFIDKEKAKLELDNDGWSSKLIPQLLGRVFYELIQEETWNFIKEFKNPTVNFKLLNTLCIKAVKARIGL